MLIHALVDSKNQPEDSPDCTSFQWYCQKGFTLIETLLVIAIATVILTAALAMYSATRSGQIAAQMVRDCVSVQAGIESLFNAQSDYDGLTNEVLYKAKKIPSSLKYDNGTLTTQEGGTLTVSGNGNQYMMTLTNVSAPTCYAMLSSINSGWTQAKVGNTVVASSANDFPVSLATASSACAGDDHTITYTGGTADSGGVD